MKDEDWRQFTVYRGAQTAYVGDISINMKGFTGTIRLGPQRPVGPGVIRHIAEMGDGRPFSRDNDTAAPAGAGKEFWRLLLAGVPDAQKAVRPRGPADDNL